MGYLSPFPVPYAFVVYCFSYGVYFAVTFKTSNGGENAEILKSGGFSDTSMEVTVGLRRRKLLSRDVRD